MFIKPLLLNSILFGFKLIYVFFIYLVLNECMYFLFNLIWF